MKIFGTKIEDVLIIEPEVFIDTRGFFMETFHHKKFTELNLPNEFMQDCFSRSCHMTIRGLHYQLPCPQGKLIGVTHGEIFDVAVDLRRNSPTFGRWMATYLGDSNHRQLYIPPGCAHGFCVTSNTAADLTYKCTEFYHAKHEHTIAWNDTQLAIDWPAFRPILSDKDSKGVPFSQAPYY